MRLVLQFLIQLKIKEKDLVVCFKCILIQEKILKIACAGDIIAVAGLKDTTTGDTLCNPDDAVILERMEFPDPVIEVAVEPKTKADQEKMGMALTKACC